jgi:2-furoyl-CoA dehydrogenase large subunit
VQDRPQSREVPSGYVGQPLERVEDAALLRGEGVFIDDLPVKPSTLHAVFVRSSVPHARIVRIDAAKALALPGVHGVITGADVKRLANPFMVSVKAPMQHWCLAVDSARFVGEPVAIVCAETPYIAEDGAALVEVAYAALPAVVDSERAASADAPLLHPAVGSNVVSDRRFRYGEPERAFAEADRTIAITVRYPRNSVTPIECLGAIAEYHPAEGAYDIQTHFQGPYAIQPVMALALGVPGHKLRIRTPPDSGGSFGVKHAVFTYAVALAIAARVTGRPVKWIEDRLEHLSSATSATNRITSLKAAVRNDGTITALDYDQLEDCGAYLRAPEPATIYRMHGNLTGAYRIPHLAVRNRIVLTNKTPSGLVRGFGGPQVYFALERLTQKIARELGLSHLDVIRRNLVDTSEFPYRTASGGLLDSGDYQAALVLAERRGVIADLETRRARARAEGRLYGIGVAAIVEPSISNMGYITTVLTPEEREKAGPKGGAVTTATVAVDALGGVQVHVSSCPQGQGHKTVLAQVVADVLGLAPADIRVVAELDTGRDAWSVASGNYSSRFAGAVAGTAHLAATRLKGRLAEIAAVQLGGSAGEVRFAAGKVFRESAPNRALPFRRLAATSHWAQSTLPQGMEPVLRETAFWSADVLAPPNASEEINSSAAHGLVFDLAGVEVDRDTGRVRIDRYVSVHDAGRLLNPALAEGQVRGGFANAVGAALCEHFAYGPDGGFLTGTFAEYTVPTAAEMPDIEILHLETASPVTALGAKGIGEGNCMSTPVCLANAVADALGVEDIELPMTPPRVLVLLAGDEPVDPRRVAALSPSAADAAPLSLSRGTYGIVGEGRAKVAAAPERVWDIVLDPEHLKAVIPGCRRLDVVGPQHYRGEVVMGVGVVKGTFQADVRLTDLDRPKALRIAGEAAGALGASRGEGVVRLVPDGEGTIVDYRYGVDLSGKVAAVGGRMIEGAARLLIGELFKRLARRAEPAKAVSRPEPVAGAGLLARLVAWLRALIGGRP